jgi:putative transposase
VAISTAINWVRRFRETGSVEPDQIGGYRPKKIAGPHREWLVQRCRKADFTLRGLVAELAERGLKVDYRTMWEFVHAEKLSHKKDADCRRARSARRGPPAGIMVQVSGADRSLPPGVHRRDLDKNQHGAAAGLGTAWPTDQGQGAARPLADHDLPGRFAP